MEFEDRVVAFVDILGFSNLVDRAAVDKADFKDLSTLVDQLSTISDELNNEVTKEIPRDYLPKTTYISDCLIISAPVYRGDVDNENWGLIVVPQRVIEITHTLLNAGYLVSGGVSIGKVFHGESNIVGPAYQEAYKIESKNQYPSVLLSEGLKEVLLKSKYKDNEIFFSRIADQICVNGLGCFAPELSLV